MLDIECHVNQRSEDWDPVLVANDRQQVIAEGI